MQQAKRAAKAIGPVDKIISSPLQRAIQTAEAFNMEVETDENWIELDYGEWDGAHLNTISKEHGASGEIIQRLSHPKENH